MANDNFTLAEFIAAYQSDLAGQGYASLHHQVAERVGSFVPPANTNENYNEEKQYPWIPEFSAVTENIMAIVSKPRTHLKVYKEVTQAEKAVKIDNTDVTMTLKVPRFWKEKDSRMLPEYIYSDTSETDYAIYENRFVVALIDKMRSFISHIIVELYNQPRFLTRYVFNGQVGLMDLNFLQHETTDALNPVNNPSSLLTDKDDPIIQTLRKLLDAQRILSHSVSTPFYKEVKKAKGLSDSDIHATNMLVGDRNYAACFRFYMKLINLASDQNRKEQLHALGYENFTLQKLLEVYKRLGFTLVPQTIGLDKQGRIDIASVTASRGALKASFQRDGDSHVIIVYTIEDSRLPAIGADAARKRKARISLDFMPGLNGSLPTVDDLNTEINHLVFHRLTPEQDFENAFVLTAEEKVNEPGAVIANPTVSKIDANLENMVRSCLTFLKGDAWTYARICPVCGAYMDGENTDGNFYCPNCDSVYAFVDIDSAPEHNEMIWVKRLHSPTHSESKTETMVLNVLRTTADIDTERLLLRVFDSTDLNDLYQITSKPGPLEMMGEKHTPDLHSCTVLLNRFIDRNYRAIIRLSDGKLIGAIGLDEKRLEGYRRFSHKKVEVFIGEEYWGNGYATEAMKAVVQHTFEALHLDMVWAQAGDFNLAAIKVLYNAGFSFIDKTEDVFNRDIAEVNELHRFVKFNSAPTMLGEGGAFMNRPTEIDVPELYDDVLVEDITEEEYQNGALAAAFAEAESSEEGPSPEELARIEAERIQREEEEAAKAVSEFERALSIEDARIAAQRLVEQGLRGQEPIVEEPQEDDNPEQEDEDMIERDPINIEITEDQTVEMEINGVRTVLYEGKKKPEPVKPAPAKKPEPKPEPKPAAAPVAKPAAPKAIPTSAPASQVERRGAVPIRKSTKPVKPTRRLAKFGPGLSDDSQHSIHTIPFEDKVKAAPKDIRAKYKALSDYLVNTYGCAHRVSFGYDSYRIGKKVVIALSLGGVHLRINAAIDPKVYAGTKMSVNDDSASKKYKDLPSYIKVIGEKSFKQAFRLIDDTMKSLGVKKVK